ncbi:MAG: hypothetical protein WAK56_10530, partial [Candidatus Sulfotelmatobacter sp.]
HFPQLAENYRNRYRDRSFLPPSYAKRISALMTRLKQKYKIAAGRPDGEDGTIKKGLTWQLPLF